MSFLKQGKGFYKSIFKLMLPLVFQNLATNVISLVGVFMVGMLGETELAAVSAATTPFFIMTLLIFGVQGGVSVLVAQYHGKGDNHTINRVLGMGIYSGVLLTALAGLYAALFPESLMNIITNNQDLIAPGAAYARVVGLSLIFTSVTGVYFAVQRSMENPKVGAILLFFSGVANVILSWGLIFGNMGLPEMGISGAAWALFISRGMELAATAVYAFFIDKRFKIIPGLVLRPGKTIAKDFFKYSIPVMLNEGLWSVGYSAYTIILGHMPNSTPILAAFTISGNIDRVITVMLMAMGATSAIIIGRDIGRGSKEEIYNRGLALSFVAFLVGVVSSLLLLAVRFFAAEQFIFPLLDLSPDAVGYGLTMLTLIAIIVPLRATYMTNLVGIFRGGGDVVYALFVDVAPMYILCVPFAALTGFVLEWGALAVFICMYSDDLFKLLLALPRLKSGKWINNITRDMDETIPAIPADTAEYI